MLYWKFKVLLGIKSLDWRQLKDKLNCSYITVFQSRKQMARTYIKGPSIYTHRHTQTTHTMLHSPLLKIYESVETKYLDLRDIDYHEKSHIILQSLGRNTCMPYVWNTINVPENSRNKIYTCLWALYNPCNVCRFVVLRLALLLHIRRRLVFKFSIHVQFKSRTCRSLGGTNRKMHVVKIFILTNCRSTVVL